MNFDNVKVPKENLIGEEGKGFEIAMKTLDFTRPMTASIAVGIARSALEHAVAYSKERKQFARPISAFQGIQFRVRSLLCFRIGKYP